MANLNFTDSNSRADLAGPPRQSQLQSTPNKPAVAAGDECIRGVLLGRVRSHDPITGATEETGTLMFRVTSSDLAPRLLPGDFAEIDPRALSPDPGKFALFNEPNGVGLQLQRIGPANAHLQVLGVLRSFHFGSDGAQRC